MQTQRFHSRPTESDPLVGAQQSGFSLSHDSDAVKVREVPVCKMRVERVRESSQYLNPEGKSLSFL